MRWHLHPRSGERSELARTTSWAICVAVWGAVAGCSFVVDSKTQQCDLDADCDGFVESGKVSGHPVCQEHVCVDLGLGPPGCVIAKTPTKQTDYLNACTTSKSEPFDNCKRLGLCDPAMPLPTTTDPSNPMITAPVNPVPPATVACNDGIAPGNVIYMFGAADFAPMLLAAQKALSKNTPPYRAVFQNNSSCGGVNSVFDPMLKPMKDPAMGSTNGGWAFYFDDNGNQVNCVVNNFAGGIVPDIGVSDLYAQTCNPAFNPGSTTGAIAEYTGPVVQFGFSVPATSGEKSISAEAVHFIFGRGGKAPPGTRMMDAAPWTEPNAYAIRNSGAASTVLTALMADVPRTKFWGIDRLSTDNLRDALLASTSINASIGILSIDYNDKNRDNLRALYLQAKGQTAGYLPDSSAVTYDKANVRDGHYPLWGYVHFFTQLQAGGVPSPQANAMVLKFRVERLDQGLIDDIIKASLVPSCAMKVARTTEMGDFSPRDGFGCGCYFDFKTKGTAGTGCQTCMTADTCPSARPACNYGFCEVR